jgi:adenosylhomocysteine nucleosidase
VNTTINVDGVYNAGKFHVHGPAAFGTGARVIGSESTRDPAPPAPATAGVITVLPVETAAVRETLGLAPDDDGFYTGEPLGTVVCVQAHEQGQGGAMNAARRLTERVSPNVLILCGIGGGIPTDLRLGDVVVATRVVGYDLGKETPAGRQLRGRAWESPAVIGRAVDRYFADRGVPAAFPGFAALPGIVGSGNTVIADEQAAIRTSLPEFNDKIIVFDMESDGLGQFCHGAGGLNWLTVRGISDHADRTKNDDSHERAAAHAAAVLLDLLHCLPKESPHGVRR